MGATVALERLEKWAQCDRKVGEVDECRSAPPQQLSGTNGPPVPLRCRDALERAAQWTACGCPG